ncbi:hypothetical protein [Fibrella arboris]
MPPTPRYLTLKDPALPNVPERGTTPLAAYIQKLVEDTSGKQSGT